MSPDFHETGLHQPEFVSCAQCASEEYVVMYPNTIRRILDSSDFTVYGESNEHPQIVRCKQCSLVYANPRDSALALNKIYQKMPVEAYLDEQESREESFQSMLELIQHFVPTGKVLDVGCSAGLFLKALPSDYERYGLEPSVAAAQVARLHTGAQIVCDNLENVEFDANMFDLITLWDVIEHLPYPRQALTRLARWTRTGGYMLLVTPRIDSLASRLLKERWTHIIRQHLFYFSQDTLARLLYSVGYKPVYYGHWIRYFTLLYLLRRIHLLPLPPERQATKSLLEKILSRRVPITLFDDLLVIAKKF